MLHNVLQGSTHSSLLPNTNETSRGALRETPAFGAFATRLTLNEDVRGVVAARSLARRSTRTLLSRSPLNTVAVALKVPDDLEATRGNL